MIKAAFFDIDGTLVSFKTHKVPESTWRAIEALRAQGIKVVIASGRPVYQIQPCLREGFDAYVTLSGSLCFDAEGTYLSNPIDAADARVIIERAQAGEFDCLAMLEHDSMVNRLSPRVHEIELKANLTYREGDFSTIGDAPVYQFCVFVDPADDAVALSGTHAVATTRWTDIFCDVIPKTGGKREGVLATCERFGIAPEETIAFGDGENDLSMFSAAGVSVAMGNAYGATLEAADYVTDDVDSDGIWNACRHFGLV